MEQLLLLNPPSTKYRYSRDYFCSKVLKANYVEHPIDLVMLSGILHGAQVQYSLLDATVSKMSAEVACRQICARAPRVILFLCGTVSWSEDKEFMLMVKRAMSGLVMVGVGDVFFNPRVFENNLWIDAVLHDFTNNDIVHFLQNDYAKIESMSIRGPEGKISVMQGAGSTDPIVIDVPRHELFLQYRYTFPFVRQLPFATVLTDFGCPFHCRFCVYDALRYKVRDLENVYEELRFITTLGIKEIFFKDQTFSASRQRCEQLLDEMISREWDFGWTAFTRVDRVDELLLQHMQKAGCHTLIFGVEIRDQERLGSYNKEYDPGILKDLFRVCKTIGIETVGTFMIGFPGETESDIDATVQFAIDLDPDYAAFNIFVDKEAVIKALESDPYAALLKDQSGLCLPELNKDPHMMRLKALQSRAIRKFYVRPAYLKKRMRCLSSLDQLMDLCKNAVFYLR